MGVVALLVIGWLLYSLRGWGGAPGPVGGPTIPAASSGTAANDPASGLRWMTVAELPPEGRRVYELIATNGPFRYRQDGATFFNNERVLPQRPRGYYREYTVVTPGSSDRGARRIVCGGQPRTSRAECFYTSDHYESFRRIRP